MKITIWRPGNGCTIILDDGIPIEHPDVVRAKNMEDMTIAQLNDACTAYCIQQSEVEEVNSKEQLFSDTISMIAQLKEIAPEKLPELQEVMK